MVMFDYRRVAILLGGLPVSLQGIEDWPCGELPFFVAVVRCCKHCELMKLMKSSNKTPWFCFPFGEIHWGVDFSGNLFSWVPFQRIQELDW